MEERKIAVVLSGVVNHRILLNKLKERGYYTILVDYLENPPARTAADEHVRISTLNVDAVEQLVVERKASLIINCCTDQVNVGIMKIAEKYGLPHPYSYQTALDIANKERMKAIMVEGGVLTTPFVCVTDPSEIDEIALHYPLYVKPADGYGSSGVTCVHNQNEAKKAVLKALGAGRNGKVIVEEEAKGKEHNIYCFPQNGKANILMMARKYTDNESEDKVVKSVGTLAPALISDIARKKIEESADRLVTAFHLDNTPMFLQVMVDDETDDVNVIEFSARMAGGISCRTIQINTGFDLFDATINAFLRIPNEMNYHAPEQYISVSSVYAHPCVFKEVTGYQELIDEGILREISLPRLSGTKVRAGSANGIKIAFLIHASYDLNDLLSKIKETFDRISVIDTEGNDQMLRGLYLSEEIVVEGK